jgi:hypothetical protein
MERRAASGHAEIDLLLKDKRAGRMWPRMRIVKTAGGEGGLPHPTFV